MAEKTKTIRISELTHSNLLKLRGFTRAKSMLKMLEQWSTEELFRQIDKERVANKPKVVSKDT